MWPSGKKTFIQTGLILNFCEIHRIAKSHQYDAEGLSEIFRQYGDHLYSKGDHSGAIEQYIKTIEKIEPSYVIRKVTFLTLMI
jgi:hypothetical protein